MKTPRTNLYKDGLFFTVRETNIEQHIKSPRKFKDRFLRKMGVFAKKGLIQPKSHISWTVNDENVLNSSFEAE